MFIINEDKSICITRGDIGVITVRAKNSSQEPYIFQPTDVVRLRVYEKNHHELVVFHKNAAQIDVESETVFIHLTKEDTKLGEIINKPKEYWYEIELNPDESPQTIVGYDTKGPKLFKLFPEGADV